MNNGIAPGVQMNSQSLAGESADKKTPVVETEIIQSLVGEIKNLYTIEKKLTNAFPDLLKKANMDDLIEGLTMHLKVTKRYVSQLEEVFTYVNNRTHARKYEEMEELIREAEELMEYIDQRILINVDVQTVDTDSLVFKSKE
jgi:ferritin-like metal-binding protein YciE